MKAALLDVNVLIALAWPNHVHHQSSLRWFKAQQPSGWATCSTQTGFVLFPDARSPEEEAAQSRGIE